MADTPNYSRLHLIAIGGSIMHNLALALRQKGISVSGSDDEIYEPARTRLQRQNLLPETEGWNPGRITADLDAVIVGMHARPDNPELLRAQELGLRIFSFPEFIYEQSRNKQRIVIAGSHGKTTTTSMILHVLNQFNRKFDYAVGAQIEGFELMVKLTDDAPVIIIEGDEYLSSPIDRRPKFFHYHHHIGVITGIAWDHINVFPSYEGYVNQFAQFINMSPKAGALIFNKEDAEVAGLCQEPITDVEFIPYGTHEHKIENGKTILISKADDEIPVAIFGAHNLQNLNAARHVCLKIGISDKQFYQAIATFKGAAKRLELLSQTDTSAVYRDFAHAPSKVKATTQALKAQFPGRKLVAILELHTFSSLNKKFLPGYENTLSAADEPVVYFNPKTIAHKKLEALSEEDIRAAFKTENLTVFTDSGQLQQFLNAQNLHNTNLLLMSSGNFDNLDLEKIVKAK